MKYLTLIFIILLSSCVTMPIPQATKPPPIEHVITVDVLGYKKMMKKLDEMEQRLIRIEQNCSLTTPKIIFKDEE